MTGKGTWTGLATSAEGLSSIGCLKNPVLDIDPNGWDSHGVGTCAVLKEGMYKRTDE